MKSSVLLLLSFLSIIIIMSKEQQKKSFTRNISLPETLEFTFDRGRMSGRAEEKKFVKKLNANSFVSLNWILSLKFLKKPLYSITVLNDFENIF